MNLTENQIATAVIDCSFTVHTRLGPGLLESVYESVLEYEIKKAGLSVQRQKPIALKYDSLVFDEGYRADLLIDEKVIVELKSVEKMVPLHQKQVLTYLKLSNLKLGILINFGSAYLKDGITRVINGYLE